MRNIDEISDEISITIEKVWYNTYMPVYKADYLKKMDIETKKNIESFFAQAKKLEDKYGKKTLGPLTEFGSGMINGRLETLRWVLGEGWGNLNT